MPLIDNPKMGITTTRLLVSKFHKDRNMIAMLIREFWLPVNKFKICYHSSWFQIV